MAYRLRAGESIEASLRRIAGEQIEKAAADLDRAPADPHTAVHEFRKRCKKIRGLVRLVRPGFPDYSQVNAWFRDRARRVSALRDATSVQESLAALLERYEDDLAVDAFADVDEWLEQRRAAMLDEEELDATLQTIRAELPDALERVSQWQLEDAAAEAIEGGLWKTCKRARKAMLAAADDGTAGQFHEWRKRVKYYRYQTKLLRPAWPPVLEAVYREAKLLSDLLGDDHDLAVLRETIVTDAPESQRHSALLALIDRRSLELRDRSLALGARLHAEEPSAHAAQLRAYVDAWQCEQRSAP